MKCSTNATLLLKHYRHKITKSTVYLEFMFCDLIINSSKHVEKEKPFQKCVASKRFPVRDQSKTMESTVYIFVRNVDLANGI